MKNNDKKFFQPNSQKGQLSIFLGISLVIIMTLIAFVINVGLFVKAKINLQNAVDAAAWAGASVQSRQLSNIGYLNWEMRNTYKEWMFKYYILGRLKTLSNFERDNRSGRTNFRIKSFYERGNYSPTVFDPYNIPSICVHFESKHGVCDMYDVPGLPRFNAVGLPSISEHHESFIDTLVKKKADECSERTILNFGTALLWAYGAGKTIMPGTPVLVTKRPGAWVQALELGMRMRNLEMIVNRPPVSDPICLEAQNGCLSVENLQNEVSDNFPLNERPLKAFWSAIRNLGGGQKSNDEVIKSFRLTEIAPRPFNAPNNSLSSFLIPGGKQIGQSGISATVKHYLDLQAYPLNLVTFFTSFVSDTVSEAQGPVQGYESEAACKSSKTAIPVPGYLFGFVKNHQVMTYYAVKGEAKFIGLMYPFTDPSGITLHAYSAAKPFGGRIGPRLFRIEDRSLYPRNDNNESKSASYISGLAVDGDFKAGDPIPTARNFFVNSVSDSIGGIPGNEANAKFSIPNLIYDFDDESDLDGSTGGAKVNIISKSSSYAQSKSPVEKMGLYDYKQFSHFLKAYPEVTNGRELTQAAAHLAIEKARRPTKYEALNYLIPTFEENPGSPNEQLDSLSVAIKTGTGDGGTPTYRLFAPLEGPNTLYETTAFAGTVVSNYLDANASAIDTFLDALRKVSDSIRRSSNQTTSDTSSAANSIHNGSENISSGDDCESLPLASKFGHFFKNSNTVCDIVPLKRQMEIYFNTRKTQSRASADFPFENYYYSTYFKPQDRSITNNILSSGFSPGPRQGATPTGENIHPFGLNSMTAKRNSYSTKFFAIKKAFTGSIESYSSPSSPSLFLESSSLGSSPPDLNDRTLLNPLSARDMGPFDEFEH